MPGQDEINVNDSASIWKYILFIPFLFILIIVMQMPPGVAYALTSQVISADEGKGLNSIDGAIDQKVTASAVSYSATITVLNPDGSPAAGASVAVYYRLSSIPTNTYILLATGITDAAGKWLATGNTFAQPEGFFIAAAAPGYNSENVNVLQYRTLTTLGDLTLDGSGLQEVTFNTSGIQRENGEVWATLNMATSKITLSDLGLKFTSGDAANMGALLTPGIYSFQYFNSYQGTDPSQFSYSLNKDLISITDSAPVMVNFDTEETGTISVDAEGGFESPSVIALESAIYSTYKGIYAPAKVSTGQKRISFQVTKRDGSDLNWSYRILPPESSSLLVQRGQNYNYTVGGDLNLTVQSPDPLINLQPGGSVSFRTKITDSNGNIINLIYSPNLQQPYLNTALVRMSDNTTIEQKQFSATLNTYQVPADLAAGNYKLVFSIDTGPGGVLTLDAADLPPDTIPPTLNSATINSYSLSLTYNKNLDKNSIPSTDDFTVTVNGSEVPVSNVNVSGTSVMTALAARVLPTDTVKIGYTPGANPITDLSGNEAGPLVNQSVVNKTVPNSITVTVLNPDGSPAVGAAVGIYTGDSLNKLMTSGSTDFVGKWNVNNSSVQAVEYLIVALAKDPKTNTNILQYRTTTSFADLILNGSGLKPVTFNNPAIGQESGEVWPTPHQVGNNSRPVTMNYQSLRFASKIDPIVALIPEGIYSFSYYNDDNGTDSDQYSYALYQTNISIPGDSPVIVNFDTAQTGIINVDVEGGFQSPGIIVFNSYSSIHTARSTYAPVIVNTGEKRVIVNMRKEGSGQTWSYSLQVDQNLLVEAGKTYAYKVGGNFDLSIETLNYVENLQPGGIITFWAKITDAFQHQLTYVTYFNSTAYLRVDLVRTADNITLDQQQWALNDVLNYSWNAVTYQIPANYTEGSYKLVFSVDLGPAGILTYDYSPTIFQVGIGADGNNSLSTVKIYKAGTELVIREVYVYPGMLVLHLNSRGPYDIEIIIPGYGIARLNNRQANPDGIIDLGTIHVTYADFNGDGQNNVNDLSTQAVAYGSKAESYNRSSALDINNDGVVDLFDMVKTARRMRR